MGDNYEDLFNSIDESLDIKGSLDNEFLESLNIQEKIDPIEGTPAVERTIASFNPENPNEAGSGHVFDLKVCLGSIRYDLLGNDWEDAKLVINNPIHVYSGLDGKLIGSANVYESDNGELNSDVFIDYNSPERLLIQNEQDLYPHATICLLNAYIKEESLKVLEFEVSDIYLSEKKPQFQYVDRIFAQ